MRQHDDDFAQQIYQAARRNFTHNLKDALDARDAWYQEKVGDCARNARGKECGMQRQPGPDVVCLVFFCSAERAWDSSPNWVAVTCLLPALSSGPVH